MLKIKFQKNNIKLYGNNNINSPTKNNKTGQKNQMNNNKKLFGGKYFLIKDPWNKLIGNKTIAKKNMHQTKITYLEWMNII